MIRKLFVLGILSMTLFAGKNFAERVDIVTIESALEPVLLQKTEEISLDELPLARSIAEKLYASLEPYFPCAGLAAPQIGINKSMFIYSFDRDPKNLEIAMNPEFTPLTDAKVEGWEACFSVILKTPRIAKVARYEKILARYQTVEGEVVEKVLEGFGAKVFQHEYDHLQGIVNVYRQDAKVRQFASKEEMTEFLKEVKKEDATRYTKRDSKIGI